MNFFTGLTGFAGLTELSPAGEYAPLLPAIMRRLEKKSEGFFIRENSIKIKKIRENSWHSWIKKNNSWMKKIVDEKDKRKKGTFSGVSRSSCFYPLLFGYGVLPCRTEKHDN